MGKSAASPASMSAASSSSQQALNLANPNNALAQFQQAAQIIEQKYPGALSAFQSYVTGGAKGALDQQTQAQLATLPVSNAAGAALDQLRGFLGLPSISPTAGLSTSLNGLITQLQNDPNAQSQVGQLSQIRDQLQAAEDIQDPAAREAAKNNIMSQMQQTASSLGPQYANIAQGLSSIQSQFGAGYSQQAQSAWSPEVIQAKLEADPGYQFRFNQGMQALNRSAAAGGNLLSGNTLAAAQEFGQGIASQEYNNTVNRLQNMVQMQAPGMNQQAGLLQNAGQYLSQTGQQLGAASGDVYKDMAQAGQNASNLQGQALLQNNQFQSQVAQQTNMQNAQMQQQANQVNAENQQQTNIANQQMGSNQIQQLSGLLGNL